MAEEQFGLPYWLDLERPTFSRLETDKTVEAVVIGGGICGLKIARSLSRYGIKSIILEGGRIGDGASSRNQGSINHGGALGYADCVRHFSRSTAQSIWQLGLENHRLLRAEMSEFEFDCDYQIEGFTYLARRDLPGWETQLANYAEDYRLLKEDGFDVAFLDEQDATQHGGSPLYAGGLSYLNDAQFHSGKYVLGLGVSRLPNVTIFEDSRVQENSIYKSE
ncbi:MAG: FAD-dependent oxidoreductase [Anaerolineae bacterium]|nr:FAD-dependent oxidoreductase [Anaerolineae bacterium]MDQ7037436.1 FAD-dependent oxidoreductase [Anaerolineae bacterium]